MTTSRRDKILVFTSFAIIYIVWGSTYLANRYAIDTIPPFFMAATRFFTGGTLLLIFSLIFAKHKSVTTHQWHNICLSASLFLSVGVGGVVWAEQFIDSGITAVIIALEPLIVVLIMWGWSGGRPGKSSAVGVILGIIGSILLMNQEIVIADWNDWLGVGAIFISITAWGFGSVFLSKADMPDSKILSASLQMLVGGLLLFPMSWVSGEFSSFSLEAVGQNSWIAWMYLVLFGSIIGFSAFNYLLTKVTPDKVATATYVHPVVAIFLGWSMRDEIITMQTVVAIIITLAGVVFINNNTGLQGFFRSVVLWRKKRKVQKVVSVHKS